MIESKKKRGPGRPFGTTKENNKIAWSIRLRPDQLIWLKSQNKPAAKIIELLIDAAWNNTNSNRNKFK